ncbi:hypothetical protein [Microbacterium sp. SLBN-146]|uniref:hypothetical protein n=1 Tax=Microbacterium sp. SLBN-146 TaxID=2768457 RepID=UPI00114FE2ED|nr:hypothetical protein [Microbacterium sp. SLBN-146]TQJ31846.1 hypothetical protein FBY39_2331 [Microbacterium sp. SLBN-146]
MSTDSPQEAHQDADTMPDTEELEEPSTEKDPGEEPKSETPDDPDADHHAVGIGVIDDGPAPAHS